MFNWYKDLIERLFSAIFEKTGEAISFLDYLSVMGLSLLFVLMLLLVVAVLAGAVVGPFFSYRKLLKSVKQKIEAFNEDSDHQTYCLLKRQIHTRRMLFWSIFTFLYLPIAIPTVLYILSLILQLFS